MGVILVVSDKDELAVFRQLFPDISIVHHGNHPLGLKWQSGVEIARGLKADPLIINGSDDILHPSYFAKVQELIEAGHPFVALKSWYVYDLKNVYRFDYLPNIPLGGGRAYSRELLEKIAFKVFDCRKDRHLDDLGYQNVLQKKVKVKILNEPLIMSVKGSWPVMNPLNAMFNSRNAMLRETIINPVAILNEFNVSDICAG